jgi:hypothetical protein
MNPGEYFDSTYNSINSSSANIPSTNTTIPKIDTSNFDPSALLDNTKSKFNQLNKFTFNIDSIKQKIHQFIDDYFLLILLIVVMLILLLFSCKLRNFYININTFYFCSGEDTSQNNDSNGNTSNYAETHNEIPQNSLDYRDDINVLKKNQEIVKINQKKLNKNQIMLHEHISKTCKCVQRSE